MAQNPSPEILKSIFSNLKDTKSDTQILFHATLTCRSWSEVGLDVLWHQLDDLEQFLVLFGKLVEKSGKSDYKNIPSHDAWRRFEKTYQSRICVIGSISPSTFRKYRPALDTILRVKSPGPLFPKLQSLTCDGYSGKGIAEDSVMFMSDSVRCFTHLVSTASIISRNLASFVDCVISRMPRLSTVVLHTTTEVHYMPFVIRFLQNLLQLEDITIPPFEDLSLVLMAIANLEGSKLKCLQVFRDEGIAPVARINLAGFHGSGLENLTVLRMNTSFTAAQQIFLEHRNLLEIGLTSHDPASAAEIKDLLVRIANTCMQVEQITLSWSNMSAALIQHLKMEHHHDIVTFGDFQSVVEKCPCMTHFHLDSPYPLSLDDTDMETLARSWPSLSKLLLCCEPGCITGANRKKLSIRSLLHLAQHCRSIQRIGLYIDSFEIPSPAELQDCPDFGSLSVLDVGYSPIQEPAPVARVLAHLMLPGALFHWGHLTEWPYWEDEQLEPWEDADLISPEIKTTWHACWKTVNDILPMLVQAKVNNRTLMEEVQRLRGNV